MHTPGPWINDGTTISARPDPENSATYVAPICTMDEDWTPEILAANARLIKAAPELLAALQTLIPHVLHYATLPHAHSGAYRDAAGALAAIAQATGEQA